MLMLLATTSRGDNVSQTAMRNMVVKRAVKEMLALPTVPQASKQHLLRGFVAAAAQELRGALPLTPALALRVLDIAVLHSLAETLESEGFGYDCFADTVHCLASTGDVALLLHEQKVAPPPADFLFANIKRKGFIVQRGGGGFKLRYLQPGEKTVRTDNASIDITVESSLISLTTPLSPQALEIFLRTDKDLDDLALAYVFNRSVAEAEAVHWHELSDTRNIRDEFAAFIATTRSDEKLNEAEMKAILQENKAMFARWLRKDMLLEYASMLLADTEHYSLDNVSDDPSASLDGKSARQIIAAALAQRK